MKTMKLLLKNKKKIKQLKLRNKDSRKKLPMLNLKEKD